MDMSEADVAEWLTAAGYRDPDGTWSYPTDADVANIFAEYERRTGYPLSVTRGRTGSCGPLYAPRIVDLLGRNRSRSYQDRIVTALLDAVLASGDWLHAFTVVRAEFEEAA